MKHVLRSFIRVSTSSPLESKQKGTRPLLSGCQYLIVPVLLRLLGFTSLDMLLSAHQNTPTPWQLHGRWLNTGVKISSSAPHQSHLALSGRREHCDPGTMTLHILKGDWNCCLCSLLYYLNGLYCILCPVLPTPLANILFLFFPPFFPWDWNSTALQHT